MDFQAYDRVKETTTTTGTGTITLAGAVTGYQSFSVVGNATQCAYCIEAIDTSGIPTGDWEVGVGTYTLSGTTLSRTTVLASSNSGSLVNFSAGTKNAYLVQPAARFGDLRATQVFGFGLTYSSSSVVLVGPPTGIGGACPDSVFLRFMALASQATVTVTTNGAINGNDSFTGPGTASVTSGFTAVVGVSTTFLTSFGTRAGSGTVTTSGTAVTGTGTKFLSQVAVGDLIGTSAAYSQVIAVLSDTSLTTVGSLALTSSAFNVIENPTIKIGSNTVAQVSAIATNLALTLAAAASGTQAGQAYTIGNVPNLASWPASNQSFMYIWVGNGSSGTGCFASTQRTTPFGITNYNVCFRRVGTLLIVAGSIAEFSQTVEGSSREYQYEFAINTNGSRVVSAGNPTSWTPVITSPLIPPTASKLFMFLVASSGVSGVNIYVRARNAGSSTVSRPWSIINNTAVSVRTYGEVVCDGAQAIDYACSGSTTSVNIDIFGYREVL